MPGIFGLSDTSDQVSQSLEAMRSAMRRSHPYVSDSLYVDAGVGASAVHLRDPGPTRRGVQIDVGSRAWVEGEVYNLLDVIAELGWSHLSGPNSTFASWLAIAYDRGELDALLGRVDGYFCAALYDPRRKKIVLASDRYGLRLLYWYHHDGLFAWASEVKGLLAIDSLDRELDETSFPCFMELGYLMEERTWFKHVHLIRPATVLEYDISTGARAERYYWTWAQVKPQSLSVDEAVEATYAALLASVERRFDPNERIGISLSGGLDSRTIFAAVNHLFPDYEGYAYTFGSPDCDDIRIAKQVTARSHWRHEVFHLDATNWFGPRVAMVWNTDGMLSIQHMHGAEFLDTVIQHADINLNGYAGDVVLGGGWISRDRMNTRCTLSDAISVYGAFAESARIHDPYYDINRREPVLFGSRVRRFTCMGSVNALAFLEQRKPLFGNQILDLVFSLDDRLRAGNRLYSLMLQRHFPRFFRDIPWQKTGKPAKQIRLGLTSLPRKALKRFTRVAGASLGIPDRSNMVLYAQWIRDPRVAAQLAATFRGVPPGSMPPAQISQGDALLQRHVQVKRSDFSPQVLRAATTAIYFARASEI